MRDLSVVHVQSSVTGPSAPPVPAMGNARILLLNSTEQLAFASINGPSEATMTFPVGMQSQAPAHVNAIDMLNAWERIVAPLYIRPAAPGTLELLVNDRVFTRHGRFPFGALFADAWRDTTSQFIGADRISMVLYVIEGVLGLELTLDSHDSVIQCTTILTRVELKGIPKFVTTWHRHGTVRGDAEIFAQALSSDEAKYRDSQSFLSPLNVVY